MGQPAFRVPGVSWGLLTVISTFVASSALWVALTPPATRRSSPPAPGNSSRCRTPKLRISSRGS